MKKIMICALGLLTLLALTTSVLGQGQQAKTLIIAVGAEATSLDVHNTRANSDENVAWYIYEALVSRNNPSLKVTPALATKWETSADGLKWTFHLKKGVFFHDGTPFNAEAVKANFDRLLDPKVKCIKSGLYSFIDRVEVVDTNTIAFVCKFPFGPVLAHLAHPGGGIASPAALKQYGNDISRHPIGTGPFTLKAWNVGVSITLERNAKYHGPKPSFESIIFKTVREDAARVMSIESGEADLAIGIPPIEAERLIKNPALQILRTPTNRIIFVGFNTKKAPFDDVRVRQALNYAVDKKAIIETVLHGYGTISDSVLAPLTWGYTPGQRYEYNPKKAQQLLKEAGVAPGTKMEIRTPQGRYLSDSEIAEAVQGYLIAIGLDVSLQTMEWGAFVGSITKPEKEADQQLFLLGLSPSTADAEWLLRGVCMCDAFPPPGFNAFYFCNQQFDDLVNKALRTVDPKARLALYDKAQAIYRAEAPMIFLNVMEYVVVGKKDLSGVIVSPLEYLFAWDAYRK